MAEGGTPKLDEQKKEIQDLVKTPLHKGDTWYLVDSKWFKQWKKYVGYDIWNNMGNETAFPRPVDNSALLKSVDGYNTLKENLIAYLDYVLVPTKAWEKLVFWYGIMERQEPIARKVVEHGIAKHCKVEVYLLELKLYKYKNRTDCVRKQFSKADTIETIENVMRDVFDISDKTDIQIWKQLTGRPNAWYEKLAKKDNIIQDAGLYQGQVLLVEQNEDNGSWPSGPMPSLLCSSSRSKASGSSSSRGSSKPGLCGLGDLGKTSYMNSALQCMSNVPPLTRYFVDNPYEQELNEDNPQGSKGEIARAYAELIKQMWCGRYSYTDPSNFKKQLSRFAPQFCIQQEQDPYEFLGFLLDGLHEDLNRIKKKPHIEVKDGHGRLDQEVSKETWDNHLRRNNSVIVDVFHGLLRFTLDCPTCHQRSVTFDPFCFLTLPIPLTDKERILEVFVIRMDPACRPIQMKVTVPKMGLVSDLCKAVGAITNISEDMLVVTDVYNHRFHKVFAMDNRLEIILDRDDIFVYEVPVNTPDNPDILILPVYLREKGSSYYSSGGTTLFGQPMLIPVRRKNTTYDDLYNIMLEKMSRYVRQPSDEWCKKNEQPKILFSMVQVNSYGSSDISKVQDDGKPIQFTNKTYIALDWVSDVKHQFYLSEEADAFEKHLSMKTSTVLKKGVITLDDCIKQFLALEQRGTDDMWYCPACEEPRQAYKRFDLWKLPKILVIHLKRLFYNRYWRDMRDTLVKYPIENFNIQEHVINEEGGPFVYDLIGVVNHIGGQKGSHYTAYAKNTQDQQWYRFDNSSVSPIDKDSLISKAAYVLFYMRKD